MASSHVPPQLPLPIWSKPDGAAKEQHKHQSWGPTEGEAWLTSLSDTRDYHAFTLQWAFDSKKTEKQREAALDKLLEQTKGEGLSRLVEVCEGREDQLHIKPVRQIERDHKTSSRPIAHISSTYWVRKWRSSCERFLNVSDFNVAWDFLFYHRWSDIIQSDRGWTLWLLGEKNHLMF